MVYKILVGGYSDAVSVLAFDPSSSPPSLKLVSSARIGQNPSWVGRHPTKKDVMMATMEGSDGKLVVMKLKADGGIEVVQTLSTQGADPCHIEWLEDEVIISNYSGSNVFFAPFASGEASKLDETSSKAMTFEGSGPNIDRQEKSHPHQAYMHPSWEELLIPDLGADKIWRLHKTAGIWTVKGAVDFEKGHGPRHVVIHDDILYTIGELTATVHAHLLPPLPAPSTQILYLDTLEAPLPPGIADRLPAEILISPPSAISPPLIYVSNRSEPHPEGDSIAIYTPTSPNSDTPFAIVGRLRTGLKNARGMMFSPDGKYLIVGGAISGGVKMFERLEGGIEFKEIAYLQGEGVEAPTSFAWL